MSKNAETMNREGSAVVRPIESTINGRVTDECGNGLGKVAVTVREHQGEFTASTRTDENGNYTLAQLRPGRTYIVTPEAIDNPGKFVPPRIVFTNLSLGHATGIFYHRPLMPTTCEPPIEYLSDLTWVSTNNGWGPVEKDMSNGENGANDGRTITLNGITYAKGLGAHPPSEIIYSLGKGYSSFVADIGIDDEVAGENLGSVVFVVTADGQELYRSEIMSSSSETRSINVDVTGRRQLTLVLEAVENIFHDHADWADARLIH